MISSTAPPSASSSSASPSSSSSSSSSIIKEGSPQSFVPWFFCMGIRCVVRACPSRRCLHESRRTLLSHPPHPNRYLIMKEQCLCLQDSKKDDEVAVLMCAQEHERYCPTPPHPTANNDESAVTTSRMRDDEGAQVSEISGAQVRVWPLAISHFVICHILWKRDALKDFGSHGQPCGCPRSQRQYWWSGPRWRNLEPWRASKDSPYLMHRYTQR